MSAAYGKRFHSDNQVPIDSGSATKGLRLGPFQSETFDRIKNDPRILYRDYVSGGGSCGRETAASPSTSHAANLRLIVTVRSFRGSMAPEITSH